MFILGGDRGKQDAGVVRPLVLSKPGENFAVATAPGCCQPGFKS